MEGTRANGGQLSVKLTALGVVTLLFPPSHLKCQNSNERRVFNGIEFYLPQLAHMIIHLDVHLPSSALEQFALVVCQQRLVRSSSVCTLWHLVDHGG